MSDIAFDAEMEGCVHEELIRLRAEVVRLAKEQSAIIDAAVRDACRRGEVEAERDLLRELLRRCYGYWLRDADPWELRAFLDRVQAALKRKEKEKS